MLHIIPWNIPGEGPKSFKDHPLISLRGRAAKPASEKEADRVDAPCPRISKDDEIKKKDGRKEEGRGMDYELAWWINLLIIGFRERDGFYVKCFFLDDRIYYEASFKIFKVG